MSGVLVVGTMAYDTVATPEGQTEKTLGGSANYFAVGVSPYVQVNVVAAVGDDYKQEHVDMLERRGVDLRGLQKLSGKTFHWTGRYDGDMNEAQTLDTQLNVLENFNPQIPTSYQNSKFVFLANIDPILQARVLDQIESPQFVGMDTMDFWIDSKIDDLKKVLRQVNCFLVNEGEARKLAGTFNSVEAAHRLSKMGPSLIIIKRGEYGFLAFYKDTEGVEHFYALPAFPVRAVVDPTGAGDTFAAGFFGYLAQSDFTDDNFYDHFKEACIHGCLLASFTVQGFGLETLQRLTREEFVHRYECYQKIMGHPVPIPKVSEAQPLTGFSSFIERTDKGSSFGSMDF